MPATFMKPTKKVSDRMRRVRSRGTSLEANMGNILTGIGVDFETQPKLPGHPDFRIVGTKVLIFCDSSFWHGRKRADLTGMSFKRNREYWRNKIVRNRTRDRITDRRLKAAGWKVLRFWDTVIIKKPGLVSDRVRRETGPIG